MPENIEEIKESIEGIGKAHLAFTKANDERLAKLEKGISDPLLEAKLTKIGEDLDKFTDLKTQLEEAQVAIQRLGKGNGGGGESEVEAKAIKEHNEAFNHLMRTGDDSKLMALDPESKTLSVGSDPDGGYLVSPEVSNKIIKLAYETTPMRSLASVISISSDSFEFLKESTEASSGGWVGEEDTRGDTDSPQIGKGNIPVHEQFAQPKATQKVLDDSAINLEQWLAEKVSAKFARDENTAFVSGNGVAKPRGILTYTAGTDEGQIEQVNSGHATQVTGNGLISLQDRLLEDYQRNASWLMKRATRTAIRQLKDAVNGGYLWQPGLTAGTPESILGSPVVMGSDMPTIAASSLAIAYGDFRQAYTIVDRIGIRILRDPLTLKGFVKFYTTKRVGGGVVLSQALKLQKIAA